MIKAILLLPLLVLLTGCPGRDGEHMSKRRSVFIDGMTTICFSISKSEVLSRYILTTNNAAYKKLLEADNVHLTYPDTCFKTHFESGTPYGVNYAVDGINYFDTFIFDNEGNLIHLGS